MTLTRQQHAKILHRYITSMPLSCLKELVAASEKCAHAAMNLGIRAQVIYAEDEEKAVQAAIARYVDSDLNAIARLIEGELK